MAAIVSLDMPAKYGAVPPVMVYEIIPCSPLQAIAESILKLNANSFGSVITTEAESVQPLLSVTVTE